MGESCCGVSCNAYAYAAGPGAASALVGFATEVWAGFLACFIVGRACPHLGAVWLLAGFLIEVR